ncbi:MAG: photosynthetic protein synthase I [Bdellovibrionaceae bacterium]|nr:photosynthetic protein synthase I [Pseudobdellovibrionaceae bacterium]|tara:strand:- start:2002 stop:2877 length:876 start_codon:yes stop_codon:yes gene_type:complete
MDVLQTIERGVKVMGIRALVVFFLFSSLSSFAASEIPGELKGVGIEEKLGNQVPITELEFKNEDSQPVRLSQYFKSGKPVVLALVYYNCPNLCNFLLNGFLDTLKKFQWLPGREFEIVTVSINPREGSSLAKEKKKRYIEALGRDPEVVAQGWHFLTGQEDQIKKLADSVGFGFRFDEKSGEFAHSSALFVLTPSGKLSRNLYGIEFPQKDFKLALLEASDGKIGTIVDRVLLFCFHYDPDSRGYSLYVWRLMRLGSAGTLFAVGGYLAVFWRRQRRKEEEDEETVNEGDV